MINRCTGSTANVIVLEAAPRHTGGTQHVEALCAVAAIKSL
jgi:hypothetical protein